MGLDPQTELHRFFLEEAGRQIAGGRHSHALQLLAKGFSLDPEGSLFGPLADICRLLGCWDELERFSGQRLVGRPHDCWAWYHLAGCSLQQLRFLTAVGQLCEALRHHPDFLEAWIELGNIWKRLGEIRRAIVCYQRALQVDPDCARAHDNLLFSMLFSDEYSPDAVAQAHRDWGTRYLNVATRFVQAVENRKIKIAYLSPDLREHSVTCFLEPLLRHHDRHRFEVTCYQCNQVEDAVTQRLKEVVDHWRNIAELSDEDAGEVIRQDGIQVLVELAGHTAGNRLALLAKSPAPVQATWLGYPHSTGLRSIGFRITYRIADPPGAAEQWHTEQLMRLSEPFLCYDPPLDAPLVTQRSDACDSGRVTFACFNRIDKASPTILAVWAALLRRLPQARLLLKSEIFADPQATARFVRRSGLPQEQLLLLARTPDRGSHLGIYNQADIALDTFPYNGTTTTCEALWMGVPVVTLAGRHHAARVGKSLLTAVGLENLVAQTPEEYLELACQLADDSLRRHRLRETLRTTMRSSALCDADRFARQMEAAYRTMLEALPAA